MTASNGHQEPGRDLAVVRGNILATVERYADSIAKLAPRGMLPDYYVEELRLYLSQPDKDGNPSKLLECTPVSIARGILRVAQTGLSLGVSCDLLPFGKVCQYSPRYTGIVELALLSGTRAINADVVYSDDILFEYQKGTEFYLRHKRGPRKGKITHFYAMGELKLGSYVFEVMTRDEVEAFKLKYSKQWKNVPIEECVWYGKKTLIRQLSKYLPKNPRLNAALQFDRQTEEEVPDADFEIEEAPDAMEHAIMDPRLDEKPADGSMSKAQKERLLDLLDHPKIPMDMQGRVHAKMSRGISFDAAATWIELLESALGVVNEAPAEAAA